MWEFIPYEPFIKKHIRLALKNWKQLSLKKEFETAMGGGISIFIDGKFVFALGVGGAHGSEDVRIA